MIVCTGKRNRSGITGRLRRAFGVPALVAALAFGAATGNALAQNIVAAWGDNDSGQLGNSTNIGTDTPNPSVMSVSGLSNAAALAAGDYHSLALKSDGTIWAWGDNQYGQLGFAPTSLVSATPMKIPGLSGVTAIAAGPYHSLALKSDGTVWAWGENTYGELGTTSNSGTSVANTAPAKIAGLPAIAAIAAGGQYGASFAVDSAGNVWAWGNNFDGQLGNLVNEGTSSPNPTPAKIIGLSNIVAVSTSGFFTLALDSSGNVWAWGSNAASQLGNSGAGGPTPTKISGLSNVAALAAGYFHALALKKDGTVWAWGDNSQGECATGGGATPIQIASLPSATAIAAGYKYSLAVAANGSAWAWGNNYYGQLGSATNNGANVANPTPTQVSGLLAVVAIAAGSAYTGFSLSVSHVNGFVWQNQTNGQLADWGLAYENGTPTALDGQTLSSTLAPPWKPVALADFNGDGQPDLLWWNSSTGEVVVWYETIGLFGVQITGGAVIAQNVSKNFHLAAAGDLNGDGYPDLIWQDTSTGNVIWWEMANENGVPTSVGGGYIAKGVSSAYSLVGAADMNRDGVPDLLWRNTTTGDVIWWELAYANGAVSSVGGGYIAKAVSLNYRLVGGVDMNGDGQPDLLWQTVSTGQPLWWKMAYANGVLTSVGGGYIASSLSSSWLLGAAF